MQEIIIKPIGIIHTPYKGVKDILIQSKFRIDKRENVCYGWLEKHFAKNEIPKGTILKEAKEITN